MWDLNFQSVTKWYWALVNLVEPSQAQTTQVIILWTSRVTTTLMAWLTSTTSRRLSSSSMNLTFLWSETGRLTNDHCSAVFEVKYVSTKAAWRCINHSLKQGWPGYILSVSTTLLLLCNDLSKLMLGKGYKRWYLNAISNTYIVACSKTWFLKYHRGHFRFWQWSKLIAVYVHLLKDDLCQWVFNVCCC